MPRSAQRSAAAALQPPRPLLSATALRFAFPWLSLSFCKSVAIWPCGLNRPFVGACPPPSGIARLVSFSPCAIGRGRPCAPLCSRVSRGVPRPARASGVGPPPLLPEAPPLPCGRALWASVAGLPRGERSRPRARAASCRLAVSRPQLAARARLRRFHPRFARSCVSPRLAAPVGRSRTFDARARWCPSLRPSEARACALCPRALCLRPLSLRRQP